MKRGIFGPVSRIIVLVERTIAILAVLAAMARGQSGGNAAAMTIGASSQESVEHNLDLAAEPVNLSETEMLAKPSSFRDTTESSYKRGEARLVECLDAQCAYNNAMQTWNEARASYGRSPGHDVLSYRQPLLKGIS